MNDQADTTQDQPFATCSCGFDRDHHRVSRNGKYTMMGWFLLLCGISVEPIKVEWECRMCGDVFDSSTDPRILAKRV